MKKKKSRYMLMLLLLAAMTGIVVAGTDVFSVEKITVSGNKEFVYNDILRLSGLSDGQNILTLNKELVKSSIESEPYIEVMELLIEFPDEVIITVRERKAIAYTEYLALSVLFDEEGIALEVRDNYENHNFIKVSGLNIQGFVLGGELLVNKEYRLGVLKRLLKHVKAMGLENDINKICVEDPNNIRFVSDYGLSIRVGQAIELDKKLRWMQTEQFKQIETLNIPGELDLSVHTQAVFVPMEN